MKTRSLVLSLGLAFFLNMMPALSLGSPPPPPSPAPFKYVCYLALTEVIGGKVIHSYGMKRPWIITSDELLKAKYSRMTLQTVADTWSPEDTHHPVYPQGHSLTFNLGHYNFGKDVITLDLEVQKDEGGVKLSQSTHVTVNLGVEQVLAQVNLLPSEDGEPSKRDDLQLGVNCSKF